MCTFNLDILTFSHREEGWSNPVYQLTPNFSVEIKTNFGFGSTSYFYTKHNLKGFLMVPEQDDLSGGFYWSEEEVARRLLGVESDVKEMITALMYIVLWLLNFYSIYLLMHKQAAVSSFE